MSIEITRTVGEIAAEKPALIPVLEDMKIDYCCGGSRSLGDACALAGISVKTAVEVLEKFSTQPQGLEWEPDWRKKSLAELADYILEKHHVYTRSQLGRLRELATKVHRVHGERYPELARVAELVHEMGEEMEGHMAKEEEQVFPYLKAQEKAARKKEALPDPFQGGPFTNHPLKVLMWEHGMTGEEFEEIHRLTRDYMPPSDACQSYQALYRGLAELERDLHRHVHLENNILFPKAMAAGILD